MFSGLATKMALRKAGIKSDTFDFSGGDSAKGGAKPQSAFDEDEASSNGGWPAWMSARKLPLTAQAWLSPAPPPVPVAECPKVGDLAPLDRDRQLNFGGGQPVVILFMRCVGCAFAQKSFLALRTLANKHQGAIKCIAVSHSSPEGTRKWVDMLGGAWNVEIIMDEDRAIYAAWGLGLGSVWYMFNPTTQQAAWKEKGWLGEKVAGSLARTGSFGKALNGGSNPAAAAGGKGAPAAAPAEDPEFGPGTVLGNKWQQAGLFAVDGRNTVAWAEKAIRADDCLDMDGAAKALGLR